MPKNPSHSEAFDAACARATAEAKRQLAANRGTHRASQDAAATHAEIARLTEMVNFLSAQLEARKSAPTSAPAPKGTAPVRRHSDFDQERLDRMLPPEQVRPHVAMTHGGIKQEFRASKRPGK